MFFSRMALRSAATLFSAALLASCSVDIRTGIATETDAPREIVISDLPPPPGIANGAEVVLISGYEVTRGGAGSSHIKLTIDRPGKKVFVVLATHEGINWELVPTRRTRIQGIVVGSQRATSIRMTESAPAYKIPLDYSHEPGQSAFFALQRQLHTAFGIARLDMVRVRYALPPDIVISALDPPSPLAVFTEPEVAAAPRVMEFNLHTTGYRPRLWRLDGPAEGAPGSAYIDSRFALSGAGDTVYLIRSRALYASVVGSGLESALEFPPDFPELSWPMDVAFDSTRGLMSLISLGGEGFLYRYDVEGKQWLDARSVNNIDVSALAYDAKSDRYAAWTLDGQLLLFPGDATPGVPRRTYDAESNRFATWTTDGHLLLFPGGATPTPGVSMRIVEQLPDFRKIITDLYAGNNRLLSLILQGDDLALVRISDGIVNAIWHYDLATQEGTLTYLAGSADL